MRERTLSYHVFDCATKKTGPGAASHNHRRSFTTPPGPAAPRFPPLRGAPISHHRALATARGRSRTSRHVVRAPPDPLGSLRMADAPACAPRSHRAARLQASPAHDSAVQAATPHPPTRSCADETGTDSRRRRRTPLAHERRTLTTHNLSVLGAPLLGRVTPCQRVYIMLSAILPPSVASVGLFLPGWCARAVR